MIFSKENPPRKGQFMTGEPQPGGFLIDVKYTQGSRRPEVTLRKEAAPQDVLDKLEQMAIERKQLLARMDDLQAKIKAVKR